MILYYDFICPFAWRGLELMDRAGVRPELRNFSLVQGNHPENPDRSEPTWWLTDQPLDEGKDAQRASLRAFLADQAADRQGDEARFAFALELFRLRHGESRDLQDPQTALTAARRAGLDVGRFEADLADGSGTRASLREELHAAAQLKVFGTPTFVLDSGEAAYFRFRQVPETPEGARALWDVYTRVLADGAGIETIKRPR